MMSNQSSLYFGTVKVPGRSGLPYLGLGRYLSSKRKVAGDITIVTNRWENWLWAKTEEATERYCMCNSARMEAEELN